MFKTLDAVGGLLQFIGALIPVFGAIGAIISATGVYNPLTPILLGVCGGFTLGAVIYGFGGALRAMVIVTRNSEKSANALSRIAQAQTGAAEFIPVDQRKQGIRPIKG